MPLSSPRADADRSFVPAFEQQTQPQADSYRPRRIGRLFVYEPSGRATFATEVLEVSVVGCELRVYTPLDTGRAARLGIEVHNTTLWVPMLIRSVRRTTHGWTVSCVFDRPSPSDQRSIYALMAWRTSA